MPFETIKQLSAVPKGKKPFRAPEYLLKLQSGFCKNKLKPSLQPSAFTSHIFQNPINTLALMTARLKARYQSYHKLSSQMLILWA